MTLATAFGNEAEGAATTTAGSASRPSQPEAEGAGRSPGKITDRRTSPAATTQGSGRRQRTDFQDSFKIEAADELAQAPESASRQGFERVAASVKRAETRLNTGRPAKRRACEEVWLGGRDSNPDNHVQSVVSYR